ncbi:hypothetical protein A2331_02075 [Candidatus Falkowbacteria bacterium RIFOXYB2_FULL_34_18]|uniref:Uncharacterized protein n=1 Tax=Candidatus Falkowbacteria bacterium RIFOXYD2_FULL_34_120 TaxID=1798007 RepID=A0A1F5TQL1_9BACT|nr:MAG: hypothetical protein A2331_02075 [Candidatus Falkowbacteria bacterium RIFOXYB2_FULL_34_18]OGF29544.1 MAG: hypothetical protein A2500_02455 [Candidatus Falkowbacteria bacterium RIFOXYC12_FULL_34_55]OGF36846.1 MAG: hypothetical protein A2466_06515 [Candidatus Falkowbacteria bacterium RIFOXYC2_FULL_34_220]OGF39045.1 MAG: hypothetical protein A2515_04520 [Candidatus Falkowbacteria bacterium RIFOXYD12_FULL_34_57]OGF41302.1 MAG: hypothetical protein A2531_00370 [Candidatus Falkowbacteria bact
MRIFTCRICGEVYIGTEAPKTCPFCGVANKYLVLASVWKDENKDVKISEVSRKNLEEALELELSNTAFYKCLAQKLANTETSLMFKGLFKVEREHASVFRKLLGLLEDQKVVEYCINDPEKAITESAEREEKAINFYAKALTEATEPRIKEVFTAIMNTEKDHLELDREMKNKIIK